MATQKKPKSRGKSGRSGVVSHKPRVESPAEAVAASDPEAAFRSVMELMAIAGPSGHEGAVANYIMEKLRAAGAQPSAVRTDRAQEKTQLGGDIGNLVFDMPGTLRAPRRMLMAHMDTVPICVGSMPLRKGPVVRSVNPQSGLGADDRAGVAVVLNTAVEVLRRKLPHPPLTFLWTIQEELGLLGAHFAQLSLLGKPRMAFNWDGGAAEKVTIGATGGYRLKIDVEGLAAHAGAAPERGVSAVAIASLAIARLVREGWHGLIVKGGKRGTSNVGYVLGGQATNVVMDRLQLKAEARSHDPLFRRRIVQVIEQAFKDAALQVRNNEGHHGRVRFDGRLDYEAFLLNGDEPAVLAAERAIREEGLTAERAVSNGGLDANWMTAHGFPTVTLGCGQQNIHTTGEMLDIKAFEHACNIALRLATQVSLA